MSTATETTPRASLADKVEQAGIAVNATRTEALTTNYPYIAGMIRSAEEALVCALTALRDTSIPERDL